MDFLARVVGFLGPWSWWVLAILLALVEVLAPGTFFIWFAIAALIVGTLALAIGLSWQVELLLFVILSLVAALIGRRVYGRAAAVDDGHANDRAGRQIGRTAFLDTAIAGGTGHIRLDDTVWRAEGPDLPAGTEVRITAFRNGRFQVEPLARPAP